MMCTGTHLNVQLVRMRRKGWGWKYGMERSRRRESAAANIHCMMLLCVLLLCFYVCCFYASMCVACDAWLPLNKHHSVHSHTYLHVVWRFVRCSCAFLLINCFINYSTLDCHSHHTYSLIRIEWLERAYDWHLSRFKSFGQRLYQIQEHGFLGNKLP